MPGPGTVSCHWHDTMGRVHRIVDRHTHHSHHIAASTKASMTSLILRALVQVACTTLLFAATESTTASNQGLITSLPNLNYNPGFRQYSGYLTVSAQHGRSLFYWYVESQNDPTTDPVVLWTNGGPGCSGLIGFWEEHGPFVLNSTLHLSPNPYSWNKVANMLYIEQPAGTGFSYSKTTADYDTADDAMSAEDNYQFILQFLERFPERKSNAFYISGESYAGHYIPQLALKILGNNSDGLINFKGMMVGNPFVDYFTITQNEVAIYFYYSLIPISLYQAWTKSCNTLASFSTTTCDDLYQTILDIPGGGIDPYALDYPVCKEQSLSGKGEYHKRRPFTSLLSPQTRQLKRRRVSSSGSYSPPFSQSEDGYQACISLYAVSYMNLSGVHDALHVNKKLSPKTWSECSDVLSYSSSDYRTNVIDLYQELIDMGKAGKHNLSMLVYSGDDDSVCPTPQTQSWISGLGISGKSSQTWVPWVVNQQTAGYVTVFDLGAGAHAKFSFVTVHGAGHEVPSFRPNEALVMFKNYLNRVW